MRNELERILRETVKLSVNGNIVDISYEGAILQLQRYIRDRDIKMVQLFRKAIDQVDGIEDNDSDIKL